MWEIVFLSYKCSKTHDKAQWRWGLINVQNAGKLFIFLIYIEYMKELMLERNPMNVRNVVKLSVSLLTYEDLKVLIGVKPHGCK